MTYLDLINLLSSLPDTQLNQKVTILTGFNHHNYTLHTDITLTFTNNDDHTDDIPLLQITEPGDTPFLSY